MKKKLLSLALALALSLSLAVPAFAAEEIAPLLPEEAAIAALSTDVIEAEKTLAASITPGVDLPVKSAVLMEQGSGAILYAENEDLQLPPASITKIDRKSVV